MWITLSASAQTYTLVRSFNTLDGAAPVAGVVQSGGVLYGTTTSLGLNNGGTVFKVNPDGTGYTVLKAFDTSVTAEGNAPAAGLVLSGITLYGTTTGGGSSDFGTVFKLNTDGTGYGTLYTFLGTSTTPPTFPNGAMPNGGLLSYNGTF